MSEPKASAYLRWDMLGLLLQEAGIGERVLIADRTKGLVTGAMVLRGYGQVTVINEDEKRHPTKQLIYQNMNIPKYRLFITQIIQLESPRQNPLITAQLSLNLHQPLHRR